MPTALAAVAAGLAALLYFSGCVPIAKDAIIAGDGDDHEIQRQVVACSPDLELAGARVHQDSIDPDGFSVLSWNSHRGSHRDWQSDLVTIARDADIILLQEASIEPVRDARIDLSANQWLMATAFEFEEHDIGILSAARVTPDAYCVSREPEPLLRIPKVGLAATYPLTGTDTTLLVVNIHMVNFTLSADALERQFDSLEAVITGHHGPVIIAGDFNTWSDGREAAVQSRMKELHMTPVIFEPDHRVRFLNHPVDGIYFRGLEVTASRSHTVSSSDHNPLEAHFRLSGHSGA